MEEKPIIYFVGQKKSIIYFEKEFNFLFFFRKPSRQPAISRKHLKL